MSQNSLRQWYNDPIFKRFWDHHNYVNNWLRNNGLKVVEFKIDGTRDEDIRDFPIYSRQSEDYSENETEENEIITIDDDDDINEGYLEFIMETKKHQAEREKLKKEKLKQDNIEYIDLAKINSAVTVAEPPKDNSQEDIKIKRNEQMHNLYGNDANIIEAMEAALLLNFNKLCDVHQPNYWPIMPVKIKLNNK